MKALCLFLFFGAIAISVNGQSSTTSKGKANFNSGYSQNSCNCIAAQQGDKIIVFSKGKEMDNGVTLSPGIKISPQGMLKKEGGAERMLVNGNCVSERGTITMQVKE